MYDKLYIDMKSKQMDGSIYSQGTTYCPMSKYETFGETKANYVF